VVRDPLDGFKVARDPILSLARVSVVVPTLNEADNLPHVFERMPSEVFEVILVDGNSTDGTIEVAKRLWPSVRVITQSGMGKGNALTCGFWAARVTLSSCWTPMAQPTQQRSQGLLQRCWPALTSPRGAGSLLEAVARTSPWCAELAIGLLPKLSTSCGAASTVISATGTTLLAQVPALHNSRL